MIEGLAQSLRSPECELELALLRRLIHSDLVDPLGMFFGPFPRSSGPLAVLQVVESAKRKPDNPAVDRAGCERNATGNRCNGLAGLDTQDDVLSNLNLLGSSKTEESK